MELNREQQIVRAYECCHSILLGCGNCPFIKNDEECADVNMNIVAVLKSQEEKIKQLTQAHEMLSESYDAIEKTKDELLAERSRLTEENERLRAQNEVFEIDNKKLKYRIYELSRENEEWEHENEGLECDLRERITEVKADTVREMQERIDKHFCHDPAFLGVEQRLIMDVISQIAKEILEGEK